MFLVLRSREESSWAKDVWAELANCAANHGPIDATGAFEKLMNRSGKITMPILGIEKRLDWSRFNSSKNGLNIWFHAGFLQVSGGVLLTAFILLTTLVFI